MERAVKKTTANNLAVRQSASINKFERMEKHLPYGKRAKRFPHFHHFLDPAASTHSILVLLLTGKFLFFASTCELEARLLPLLVNRKTHGKRQVTLGRNTGCKDKNSYAI